MEIIAAITLALKIAELAAAAAAGVEAAAAAYARIYPMLSAIATQNRSPTSDEWKVINGLLDDAVASLLRD